FLSTSLSFFFLYYLVLEGVIGATFGKLIVGLRILDTNGKPASLFSILLRNLFRFMDLLLFPFLFIMFMEGTKGRQRFGDFVARAIVIKVPQKLKPEVALLPASTTRRLFCLVLDLFCLSLLAGGLSLLIPPGQEALSLILLNLIPLVILFYFLFPTALWGGTPGKLLLGLIVVDEYGHPVGLGGMLIRTLFLPCDMNPFSYLCAVLSRRKQRMGDVAGGTLVIRTGYRWHFPVVFLVTLFLAVSLNFAGRMNPNSFLKQSYALKVSGRPITSGDLTLWAEWATIPYQQILSIPELIREATTEKPIGR
ncbi:MAG: RDD family protein, partial [bacterium]|nr:RDD family protein [bacterium]